MKSESIWQEMRGENAIASGWRSRRATPEGYPIELAFQPSTGILAIVLPVDLGRGDSRRHWPECRGLEVQAQILDARSCLVVKLREPEFEEVFSIFADDVVRRIVQHDSSEAAIRELLGRLRVWQQFLAAMAEPMTLAARRGLWGELYVLVRHLAPIVGVEMAALGWTGASPKHQDFQLVAGAVEVKLTTAKQPQSIRITSERQLDYRGPGMLALHIIVADEDEQSNGNGSSLNSVIRELRELIGNNTALWLEVSEELLNRGWVETRATLFDSPAWHIRAEHTFRVGGGFPRITEAMLPPGVGDVNYALGLSACEEYRVGTSDFLQTLCGRAPPHLSS
jgi:hypothetical protein